MVAEMVTGYIGQVLDECELDGKAIKLLTELYNEALADKEESQTKIYQLEYSYDKYMDGRTEEMVNQFSTLDKAFQFIELMFEKKRELFESNDDETLFWYVEDVNRWDTAEWHIKEVIVDADLVKILERNGDGNGTC